MRAQGGWGKHIPICSCHSQSIFFELPPHSFEATRRKHTTPKEPARANASGLCVGGCVWFADARATTKRGYGSASVAVRAEKRAIVSEAYWFASPRDRGVRRALEPLRAPRVRLVVKILRILPEIYSNFAQYTPPYASPSYLSAYR